MFIIVALIYKNIYLLLYNIYIYIYIYKLMNYLANSPLAWPVELRGFKICMPESVFRVSTSRKIASRMKTLSCTYLNEPSHMSRKQIVSSHTSSLTFNTCRPDDAHLRQSIAECSSNGVHEKLF